MKLEDFKIFLNDYFGSILGDKMINDLIDIIIDRQTSFMSKFQKRKIN